MACSSAVLGFSFSSGAGVGSSPGGVGSSSGGVCSSSGGVCSSSGASTPSALALAIDSDAPYPWAVKLMSPLAVISLAVVDSVMSSTMFNARDAPTPTVLSAAAPSAVVLLLPVCLAVASTSPTVSNPVVPAAPMLASVSLVTMVMANPGLMAIPPAAPVWLLVSLLLSDVALSVNLPAFVRFTLSLMAASALFLSMSKATDAPIPTLASPSCMALASVMLLVLFSASRVIFPLATSTMAPLFITARLAFSPV